MAIATIAGKLTSALKHIFLTLLLLLKLIFILVIFSPIFLSRWIVAHLAKVFKPEFHSILNRFNSVFTVRDPALAERNNVILTLKIAGTLNYETILSQVAKIMFECKPNSRQLVYPEFHFYWKEWLGFPFWRWEKNFRVKNHVSRETGVQSDDEDFITRYENALLKKPFPPEISPWEIVVLDCPGHWYLFFKFHHSIADGYSIFNLMMRCSDESANLPNINEVLERERSRRENQMSLLGKIGRCIIFPFSAAYEIVRLESAMAAATNPLKLPDRTICAEKVIVKSVRISTEGLKRQSKRNRSSFTGSMISAISLGIQRHLRNYGKAVPESILAQLPVPIPGRPEGLTNHFSMVCLKLPTDATVSEKRRLEICEQEISRAKTSYYKEAMYLMIKLLGSLPAYIQKHLDHVGGTVEIATFPGPRQLQTFYGQPVLDMYYNVVCGQYSLDLCILSYNGGIRIVANADPNVFPNEKVLGDLVQCIIEEIGRDGSSDEIYEKDSSFTVQII